MSPLKMPSNREPGSRTILGIRFFQGTAEQAVQRTAAGGLVLSPAAPALKDIATNSTYRESLLQADTVLADSAFMVLVWNLLERDHIARLSGLAYLRALLLLPSFRSHGNTLWIMPSPASSAESIRWLATQGIIVPTSHLYIAPEYAAQPDGSLSDMVLLDIIDSLRPIHIVLAIGGGTQEPLGLYLKQHLRYRPAIHCIGAAIAFLSGDQVAIPVWADRLYLGWVFRTASNPRRFGRRYWEARKLFGLLRRYRDRLPDLRP